MYLGAGLVIIICLWLSAFLVCTLSATEPGRCPFVTAIYFVAISIITLVLIFLPRAPADAPTIPPIKAQVQDSYVIYRLLLCAFIGVSFVIGIIVTVTGDLAEQVQARPLNKLKM